MHPPGSTKAHWESFYASRELIHLRLAHFWFPKARVAPAKGTIGRSRASTRPRPYSLLHIFLKIHSNTIALVFFILSAARSIASQRHIILSWNRHSSARELASRNKSSHVRPSYRENAFTQSRTRLQTRRREADCYRFYSSRAQQCSYSTTNSSAHRTSNVSRYVR